MNPPEPGCDICVLLQDDDSGDEVILTTPWWRLVLASEQSYLGRAYLTARRHVASLSELALAEWINLQDMICRYESLVQRVYGATNFNWGCLLNEAFREPSPKPHVHWHVRPRYSLVPMVDGHAYPDPNFGSHYRRSQPRQVDRATLARIAELLRAQVP